MFDTTEEFISLGEVGGGLTRNVAGGSQRVERRDGLALAQFGLSAAPNQLLRLREEFDFANATASELDVVTGDGDRRAAAIGVNLPLDRMDVLDRGEVEVFAPQKRRQCGEEFAAGVAIAGHRPRADQRRALPILAGA